MNQAVDMLKHNDTDLLKLDQVESFRQYLIGLKCKTRKGNGHAQLLFVGTPAGWAVVQKGAGGTVKTPVALRPVIEDFLGSPRSRAMGLQKSPQECKGRPGSAPQHASALDAAGHAVEACHASAADRQHLEDLRDDFAIHCSLPMREDEDMASYCDRRWAYADLMMTKRPPLHADK